MRFEKKMVAAERFELVRMTGREGTSEAPAAAQLRSLPIAQLLDHDTSKGQPCSAVADARRAAPDL